MPEEAADNNKGIEFYFLQLKFYCDAVWLNSGAEDVLGCIAIDPALVKDEQPVLIKGKQLPFVARRYSERKIHKLPNKVRKVFKAAPA